VSEQDQGQAAGPEEAPAVTVQAGLAAGAASVGGDPEEVPDLNWWPDGTEGSDEP
jgi:hypothetical protein